MIHRKDKETLNISVEIFIFVISTKLHVCADMSVSAQGHRYRIPTQCLCVRALLYRDV